MPTTKRTKMTVERLAEIICKADQTFLEERYNGTALKWPEIGSDGHDGYIAIAKAVLKDIAEAK